VKFYVSAYYILYYIIILYCIILYYYILLYYIILYYIILYYIILWDHCRLCGPSLTETSLCNAYLYSASPLREPLISRDMCLFPFLWGDSCVEHQCRSAFVQNALRYGLVPVLRSAIARSISVVCDQRFTSGSPVVLTQLLWATFVR